MKQMDYQIQINHKQISLEEIPISDNFITYHSIGGKLSGMAYKRNQFKKMVSFDKSIARFRVVY